MAVKSLGQVAWQKPLARPAPLDWQRKGKLAQMLGELGVEASRAGAYSPARNYFEDAARLMATAIEEMCDEILEAHL